MVDIVKYSLDMCMDDVPVYYPWPYFKYFFSCHRSFADFFIFLRTFLQRIAYAKTKSDAVAKLDGTYDEAEVESRKQARREANEAAKLAGPGAKPSGAGGAAHSGSSSRGYKDTIY